MRKLEVGSFIFKREMIYLVNELNDEYFDADPVNESGEEFPISCRVDDDSYLVLSDIGMLFIIRILGIYNYKGYVVDRRLHDSNYYYVNNIPIYDFLKSNKEYIIED